MAVAASIWADGVIQEVITTTDHDKRIALAARIFGNPEGIASTVLFGVIAANNTAATGAITGAADTAIQGNVGTLLDALAINEVVPGTP